LKGGVGRSRRYTAQKSEDAEMGGVVATLAWYCLTVPGYC
jgi:hypothetical protein